MNIACQLFAVRNDKAPIEALIQESHLRRAHQSDFCDFDDIILGIIKHKMDKKRKTTFEQALLSLGDIIDAVNMSIGFDQGLDIDPDTRIGRLVLSQSEPISPYTQPQVPLQFLSMYQREQQSSNTRFIMTVGERVAFDHMPAVNNQSMMVVTYQTPLKQALLEPPCMMEYTELAFMDGVSLGQFFDDLTKAETSCHSEHLVHYCHNETKVTFRAMKTDIEDDQVYVWTKCENCRTFTDKLVMDSAALSYPFGMYLNLIINCPSFMVNACSLCKAPLNRLNSQAGKLLSKAYDQAVKLHSVKLQELLKSIGSVGSSPHHELTRCYSLKGYKIEVYTSKIELHNALLPSRSLGTFRVNELPSSLDKITLTLDGIWKSVFGYLSGQAPKLQSNSLLKKYMQLFQDRLREEQSTVQGMLQMFEEEVQINERQVVERRRAGNVSPDSINLDQLVLKSRTVGSRMLRKSILDKVIAVQREVYDFVETIQQEYPFVDMETPKFALYKHPDTIVNEHHDVKEPYQMMVEALQSQPVRDLLSILEECDEIAMSLEPKQYAYDDFDSFANHLTMVQRVLEDGKYPLQFTSDEGKAWIVDGKHIKFERTLPRSIDDSDVSYMSYGSSTDGVYSVTVHYALYYHILRKEVKLSLVEFCKSLFECQPWQPTGGKSASKYFRSQDHKFVIKQLGLRKAWFSEDSDSTSINNSAEGKMMLEFAPKYLSYMLGHVCAVPTIVDQISDTARSESPSLLVKTLASFEITLSGSQQTFVVMEDLFHGQNVQQKFDLKGIKSRQRHRRVASEGSSLQIMLGLVPQAPPVPEKDKSATLWDGNWLKTIHRRARESHNIDTSLYLHNHAKILVMTALNADVKFLTRAGVIDYSMLVGVTNNSLMFGIADYFAVYDVWKMLENKGKVALKMQQSLVQRMFQQEKKVEPLSDQVTVQAPEKYADRFMAAMDEYFMMVPDQWSSI